MYGPDKIRYNMILGRDILKTLVLYLKISDSVMKEAYGPFEMCTSPMVKFDTFGFKNRYR